jgi:ATP-dependent RNA helicase RhlE
MDFSELSLLPALQRAIVQQAYTTPTPIQQRAIPPILNGQDLLASAQTGTGKTAAFALPTLQRLTQAGKTDGGKRPPRSPIRALVLTPTRELALQIFESFRAYGRYLPLRTAVVYGGVSQKPQEEALRRGVDILVATPGRLDDLMRQGIVRLQNVEIFILDEADRMLDMGFIHDVRKIASALPEKRQTLLFSATLPPEIDALSGDLLTEPVRVSVAPDVPTVDAIDQRLYFVNKEDKRRFLLYLFKDDAIRSAIVFTRTKHGADRVARELRKGGVSAEAIHGNKSQGARQQALNQFKNGGLRALVATDLASRGLDIDALTHVINFDIPDVADTYVHRIGRTGRAGHTGVAISLCGIDERKALTGIEKLMGKRIMRMNEPPRPVYNAAAGAKTPPVRDAGARPSQRQAGGPARAESRAPRPGARAHGERRRNRPDRGARHPEA